MPAPEGLQVGLDGHAVEGEGRLTDFPRKGSAPI
jgi:hypothetical protein